MSHFQKRAQQNVRLTMFGFRRKQLSEEPDDWVPLGRKNDTKKKPEKPSWKESDIIVRAFRTVKNPC